MAQFSVLAKSSIERGRLDAEYYLAKYLQIVQILKSIPHSKLGESCFVTSGSTPPDRDDQLREGIILLKTQNIQEGFIDLSHGVFYIDEKLDDRLKSTRLKSQDILLNIVGATPDVIGRVAIVPEDFPRANITQAMSLIRVDSAEFLPEYVFAFLFSKYGRLQVSRLARPTGQFNINHQEVREIILPKMPSDFQFSLAESVQTFFQSYSNSVNLYAEAESQLMNRFDIASLEMNQVFYTSRLSEIKEARRLDSNFFKPKYTNLLQQIRKQGFTTIKEIAKFNERGIQPKYESFGDVRVVTSKHLGRDAIDYQNLDYTASEEWVDNEYARVQEYDVLIYATGAYVGRTNCFLENFRTIASNHINILRVKGINPMYLAVFLNSILGLMQTERLVRGSAQVELYPSDIDKILIWNAPKQVQENIAELIIKSFEERNKAVQLLRNIKSLTERKIEEQARSLLVPYP